MQKLWKKKNKEVWIESVNYPSNICVKTSKGMYYINSDGKRYKILSKEIFDSWSFPFVVNSKEEYLTKFPIAVSSLALRNGSLVFNIKDGKIYLVSENKLRHVVGVRTLNKMGLSINDAMTVSDDDLKSMKRGTDVY